MISLNDLMIKIPSGEIELRDDRVNKKWTTKIDSFILSRYLVTQKIYFEVMNENPSEFHGENLPVENVTWKESAVFCNKLSDLMGLEKCYSLEEENITFDITKNGFRLPTEAEWEFACKAGKKEIRYGEIDKIAWYKVNSGKRTHEVGTKEPNSWGLYDMLGNVWEWCSDVYDESVYGSYRIFRGGGWCDEERSIMSTNRRRSHPINFRIDDLGFRIAKNIIKTASSE